ncbi:MAG: hypothetical protein U0L62_01970 [Paludibacteraceae bacterium]|nr:hypothetical protein [Paludibacteraceae bacterium]
MIIRKAILNLMLLFGAITMHAATGTSCYDAIPLGKDYTETINGPKTVWYVAKTFDLPVKVCFTPVNIDLPAPDVEMDFTCIPGVYEDSILNSLFGKSGSTGVTFDMPHKPVLVLEDGAYCISMGKKYRDLLLQAGISYNVEVYVKVTFKSAGTLSMVPDTEFADCMDGGKFTQLGDTINVLPKDKDRHVILPYVQWSKDSIRYIWQGTALVSVAIANTCGIDPTDYTDERIVDRIEMQPGDTVSYTAAQIKYYASFENVQAGMYYGKFYSNGTGVLKIERVPIAPPDGGAVLLQYGKTVSINADDTQLYALSKDTVSLRFDSPTDYILRMYVGATADFTPETALATYQYPVYEGGHTLMLTADELAALWAKTSGKYLYVRFATNAATTVTPDIWYPSECAKKWNNLPQGNLSIKRIASGRVYYKIVYSEWKGGDITIKETKGYLVDVYVEDTCGFETSDTHLYNGNIKRRGTLTIPAATVNTWAEHVDDEGNLYILFDPNNGNTTITISSTAPEEQDPEPPLPAATIHVACISEANANIEVSVSVAQQLTITNAAGMVVQQWNATTAASQKLMLNAGTYTLKGDNEQITIVL